MPFNYFDLSKRRFTTIRFDGTQIQARGDFWGAHKDEQMLFTLLVHGMKCAAGRLFRNIFHVIQREGKGALSNLGGNGQLKRVRC